MTTTDPTSGAASVKQIGRCARLALRQRLDDETNERLHDDEEPDR